MPTTTNYGWTTPADTDLVKDGASAIRTLGTAIDTTVFNNAGAAIAKTIVDAKGDIIAATAADTVSRLAVGSNNQVLTADSSAATGIKWADVPSGGMTLLSTTTISNNASVSLTSISASYEYLVVRILALQPATNNTILQVRLNSDSGSNYFAANANASMIQQLRTLDQTTQWEIALDYYNGTSYSFQEMTIFDYANTTTYKRGFTTGFHFNQATTTDLNTYIRPMHWRGTSAVSSIEFTMSSGNITSGTIELYGVK